MLDGGRQPTVSCVAVGNEPFVGHGDRNSSLVPHLVPKVCIAVRRQCSRTSESGHQRVVRELGWMDNTAESLQRAPLAETVPIGGVIEARFQDPEGIFR